MSFILRHIRDGKELTPILEDNHYDFNYQSTRAPSEEIRIMPGDDLIVECDYDTSGRTKTTFGGINVKFFE